MRQRAIFLDLVGRKPWSVPSFCGAGHVGERLNRLYRENLSEDGILAELGPLIARYGRERLEGEPFGDFTVRIAIVEAVRCGREFHGSNIAGRE
jgi:sulfite reductase (NADPH) hemoprotein beta-component